MIESSISTYWGREKIAPIFPDDIFKCLFVNEMYKIPLRFLLTSFANGPEGSKQYSSIESDNGLAPARGQAKCTVLDTD